MVMCPETFDEMAFQRNFVLELEACVFSLLVNALYCGAL